MAPMRPRLSERRKAVGAAMPPEIPSEVWLDRAEFQELTRSQGPGASPASRSADGGGSPLASIVAPRVPAEPTHVVESSHTVGAGPSALFEPVTLAPPQASSLATVSPPAQTDAADRPFPVAIPGRSRWVKWFGMAGVTVLAFAGWAAWAVFAASPTGSTEGTGPVAPKTLVAANPSPGDEGHVDSSIRNADPTDPTGPVQTAPAVTLDQPLDRPLDQPKASRPATAVPEARNTQSGERAISRPKIPGTVTTPPRSEDQATRDEVHRRLSAAFGPDNERWSSFRRGYPRHR